jgi:hypothetical protein
MIHILRDSFSCLLSHRSRTRPAQRRAFGERLILEALEERTLPATLAVVDGHEPYFSRFDSPPGSAEFELVVYHTGDDTPEISGLIEGETEIGSFSGEGDHQASFLLAQPALDIRISPGPGEAEGDPTIIRATFSGMSGFAYARSVGLDVATPARVAFEAHVRALPEGGQPYEDDLIGQAGLVCDHNNTAVYYQLNDRVFFISSRIGDWIEVSFPQLEGDSYGSIHSNPDGTDSYYVEGVNTRFSYTISSIRVVGVPVDPLTPVGHDGPDGGPLLTEASLHPQLPATAPPGTRSPDATDHARTRSTGDPDKTGSANLPSPSAESAGATSPADLTALRVLEGQALTDPLSESNQR